MDQALLRIGGAAAQTSSKALQMTPDAEFAAGQAFADINEPFEAIVEQVAKALTEIGEKNVRAALRGLDITDPAVLNQALNDIRQYARDRAAEMVGRKWVADLLVEDPGAEMAIDSLTQKGIADSIANVLEAYEGGEIDAITTASMSEELLAQYAFSGERAGRIAEFESRRVANLGFLHAWKASGVVTGKYSMLSPSHVIPDICDDIEAMGVVDVDDNFNGYGFGPPWHAGGCQCRLGAVRADEDLDVDYLDEQETGGKATTLRAKALDVFDLEKEANIFELARSL